MNEEAQNPFSPRAVLALVVMGAAVFVLLLWMMGAGMMSGSSNDGGAHVGGKGLNGYAAMADYLERRGYTVRRSRSETALDDEGLLVLTPPQIADGAELNRIVQARRLIGPTLVVTPKWIAAGVPSGTPDARKGWVVLAGTQAPSWTGFLDDVTVDIAPTTGSGWAGAGLSGKLPRRDAVLSGRGENMVTLVTGGSERVLAGYIYDEGVYPALEELAGMDSYGDNENLYPVVVVFEPDLLDNYGMGDRANAELAERLIGAAAEDAGKRVTFDMTLNGLGRSPNLLTLAFTPPFLAATLCLIIAALVAGWRAFLRFGSPRKTGRAIAFGKGALVANTAGLIRRTRRLRLIAAPYATASRERLAKALALPRLADAEATERAIDRALAGRDAAAPSFSEIATRLRAAHQPEAMLKAARELHSLERKLTR